jgi:hypothetical protein
VHLTATGLTAREHNLMAEPFEQSNGRLSDGGVEGVAQAGNEESYAHR